MAEHLSHSERFTAAMLTPATLGEVVRRGKTNPLESSPVLDKANTEKASVTFAITDLQDESYLLAREQELLEAVLAHFHQLGEQVPFHLQLSLAVGSSENVIAKMLRDITQDIEESHQVAQLSVVFITRNGQLDVVAYAD